MNHGPRMAHVGDRYSNADFDDLRTAIESVAAFLLEKAGATAAIHGIQDARRSTG